MSGPKITKTLKPYYDNMETQSAGSSLTSKWKPLFHKKSLLYFAKYSVYMLFTRDCSDTSANMFTLGKITKAIFKIVLRFTKYLKLQ